MEFLCQIWLQSWNLLKIGVSWITPKFQVICWDIYYFSERLRCRLSNKKTQNYQWITALKKKCAELVNMGGAAGEWLITEEFSIDLDEMDIFVLSKNQTFTICITFLDPAKLSILVTHLFSSRMKNKCWERTNQVIPIQTNGKSDDNSDDIEMIKNH